MSETHPNNEEHNAPPAASNAQAGQPHDVSPNRQITRSPNRSRSREMLGGPVLGVAVFLIAAFLLGWGLISLLNVQLDSVAGDNAASDLDIRFDPEAVYIAEKDLLIGVNKDAQQVMLYPDYDALPGGTPNQRYIPRVTDYLADPANEKYADTMGVVVAGTRVRFERVDEEPNNPQARFHAHTLILDGEHAGTHARGMFLETVTTHEDGRRLVAPREDLFIRASPPRGDGDSTRSPDEADGNAPEADPATEPIQSPAGSADTDAR